MILAEVASGMKSSDAFSFIEKLAALSKFLLNALQNVFLLCASERTERWVHDVDL